MTGKEGSAAALNLQLNLYPDEFILYQFTKTFNPPPEILQLSWYTISRTDDELSIVLPSAITSSIQSLLKVPAEGAAAPEGGEEQRLPGFKEDRGWVCMKLMGVFDFTLVGILTEIINPLKQVQVPVFVVSTYNTDYVFIKAVNIDRAKQALSDAGITVTLSPTPLYT